MATVFIQKESTGQQVFKLNNSTGAALSQYELTVIGGRVLIANDAIASGSEGGLKDAEGLSFQVSNFVTDEDTFATVNADVFWDPTSGYFSDTSTAGYYKVGIVQGIKNSNGAVLVLGVSKTEAVSA